MFKKYAILFVHTKNMTQPIKILKKSPHENISHEVSRALYERKITFSAVDGAGYC